MKLVDPPSRRRERKKKEVRERLLREARRLIASQGLWSTTTEEIAAAADVAPATFFNYFPNKTALLGAMATDLFDGCLVSIERQRQRRISTEMRLASFFADAATPIADAHKTLRDLGLLVIRCATAGETLDDPLGRLRRSFSSLLYQGQVEGDVRSDIDAAFLAEMVVGTFLAVLLTWLGDPRYPLEARLCQAASFVSEALRHPAPGRTRPATAA